MVTVKKRFRFLFSGIRSRPIRQQ